MARPAGASLSGFEDRLLRRRPVSALRPLRFGVLHVLRFGVRTSLLVDGGFAPAPRAVGNGSVARVGGWRAWFTLDLSSTPVCSTEAGVSGVEFEQAGVFVHAGVNQALRPAGRRGQPG